MGARALPGFPGHPVNLACNQTLSWHDNRWWSTSHSLESRPLKSLTSRLFVDRDEEEPRAIRERWSVFINSVLKNFPTGARVEDRPTSGWEEARRTESVRKNEEKKRSDGESLTCSKSRPDAHANLYPGIEPRSEGTRNLHGGAARETVVSNGVISPWIGIVFGRLKLSNFQREFSGCRRSRGLYEGISRYWMASSLAYISPCSLNRQLKSIRSPKGPRARLQLE